MLALLITTFSCGCAWRTSSSLCYLGPFFMRSGGAETNLCQTIHVPVLLQMGRECGLSLGWEDRLSTLEKPFPTSAHWRLRFCQSLPLATAPELSRNQFFGMRLQAGAAATGFTAGFASNLEFRPRNDGIYLLAFDSTQPMKTRFRFWREPPPDWTVIITKPK